MKAYWFSEACVEYNVKANSLSSSHYVETTCRRFVALEPDQYSRISEPSFHVNCTASGAQENIETCVLFDRQSSANIRFLRNNKKNFYSPGCCRPYEQLLDADSSDPSRHSDTLIEWSF
jgi:hypothetical protein